MFHCKPSSSWGTPFLGNHHSRSFEQPASQCSRWAIGQWESPRTSRWQTSRRGPPGRAKGRCSSSQKGQLVGGLNPSEKYESQLGWSFPICGKINKTCSKPPTSIMYFRRGLLFSIETNRIRLACIYQFGTMWNLLRTTKCTYKPTIQQMDKKTRSWQKEISRRNGYSWALANYFFKNTAIEHTFQHATEARPLVWMLLLTSQWVRMPVYIYIYIYIQMYVYIDIHTISFSILVSA